MSSIRGYAGFFNGHYIRSSYEYVMANILIKENKLYKYEDKTYYLKSLNLYYKPDFTIFNENLCIEKIVEVKGGRGNTIKKAIDRANALNKEYSLNIEVYDYSILKKECERLNLDINKLRDEWINDISTTDSSKISFGENNPMYGNRHTLETKEILSQKSKKLWAEKREYIIKRTKEGMKNVDMKSVVANSNRHFAEYENRVCVYCGNEFNVNKRIDKKFCNLQCANKYNNPKIPKKVSKLPAQQIRDEINAIAINNKKIIMSIPLNKISFYIDSIFGELMNRYNIKDERTLIYQYFGRKEYRKSFIKALKEYLENVC